MEAEIRGFLAENFLLGDDAQGLAPSASLIDAGIIDSTGVLELVGFLEQTYDIRISEDELLPENLDSIENMLRFIQRKRSATGST